MAQHPRTSGPHTLFGFGGFKGSGKDAAAEALVSVFGFRKDSVSLAIDAAVRQLDPIVDFDASGPLRYSHYVDVICHEDFVAAKRHPEVRRLLQETGSLGRSIKNSVWIDRAEARAVETLRCGRGYAMTGIRFPGERDLIHRLGGLTVWIARPGYENDAQAHVTETSTSPADFDLTLVNDGSLTHLHELVIELALGR